MGQKPAKVAEFQNHLQHEQQLYLSLETRPSFVWTMTLALNSNSSISQNDPNGAVDPREAFVETCKTGDKRSITPPTRSRMNELYLIFHVWLCLCGACSCVLGAVSGPISAPVPLTTMTCAVIGPSLCKHTIKTLKRKTTQSSLLSNSTFIHLSASQGWVADVDEDFPGQREESIPVAGSGSDPGLLQVRHAWKTTKGRHLLVFYTFQ